MAHSKDSTNSDTVAASALEAKVHDMMDVEKERSSVVMPDTAAAGTSLPPLDIFNSDAPGAPAIVGKPKPTKVASIPDETIEPLQVTAPEETPTTAIPATELQSPNLDTPQSDAAIDDIVAQEADEVLAAEDAGIAAAELNTQEVESSPQKHGHPIFWFFVLLLVIIAVLTSLVFVRPDLLSFSV